MKKCTKCQQLYADSLDVCPVCNTELQECDDSSPMEKICKFLITKFYALSRRLKTIIVCVLLVITFILGFSLKSCTGIQKTDYDNALHRIDVLTENNNKITEEYDAYKSKMQPYEEQQKADEKAAEEKKLAEEKAKKEAEEKAAAEKAAQEAEAKRQADEQAKNNSFGMSENDFYTTFNSTAAGNGYDVFLGKATTNGNMKNYLTMNDDVTLMTYVEGNYLQTVSITAKRTTSESLSNASYYAVTTAMVLDSSLSANTIDSFMADLITNAKNNSGADYSQTKNGIKYTANVSSSSLFFYFSKAN